MQPQRLSAGIILIRHIESECRYLVLRAYGYWDFPKGEVETGEQPIVTARRETAEETGIEQLEFRWQDKYYETPSYASGKVARYYLAETQESRVKLGINPELGRPEHHEFRWVSYSEARSLLNDRVRTALDWAQQLSGCSGKE
jgi:8-oxo-dGTP pyrophosphatase MutT (NUDIX family)